MDSSYEVERLLFTFSTSDSIKNWIYLMHGRDDEKVRERGEKKMERSSGK